jgi:hypothetical protein
VASVVPAVAAAMVPVVAVATQAVAAATVEAASAAVAVATMRVPTPMQKQVYATVTAQLRSLGSSSQSVCQGAQMKTPATTILMHKGMTVLVCTSIAQVNAVETTLLTTVETALIQTFSLLYVLGGAQIQQHRTTM